MQPLFLVKIAGIPFYSYTVLITAGFVAALVAALPGLRRAGLTIQDGAEAAACITAPALVCGRIAHVLYNVEYFVERPTKLLWFADGGLGLVGVAIGGTIGLNLWCRWRGRQFIRTLDLVAVPVVVLATAAWIGALLYGSQYGAPSDGLFAVELRDEFGVILPRWPTQLLAAIWSALSALAALAVHDKTEKVGLRAGVILLLYSSGLFVLDATRGDLSLYILGLRLNQWLYVVAFATGILYLGRSYSRT